MITQFNELFSVRISHAYYGGACEDFDFVVPADTAHQLANGKLVAKARDGRLIVFYEANASGAPLISLADKTLRIGMHLLNPHFSNVTEPTFATPTLLYRNSVLPRELALFAQVDRIGHVVTHPLAKALRPVTVTLKNTAGQILQTDTINVANDRSAVSFDLTGKSAGLYFVDETYPAETLGSSYYLDPDLAHTAPFGVLEIKIDNGFYAAPAAFEIPFEARKEALKYYVAAKNYSDADLNLLSVTDSGFADEARPQVQFTRVNVAAFTAAEISPAVFTANGAKVVLFASQTIVPRRQKARQKIQLRKNGEVLISHLPQPGADKANSDIIIQLSKP